MQVGFMMQKALGELFILKSTKPLPIIFKHLQAPNRSWKISHGVPEKSWIFLSVKEWESWWQYLVDDCQLVSNAGRRRLWSADVDTCIVSHA